MGWQNVAIFATWAEDNEPDLWKDMLKSYAKFWTEVKARKKPDQTLSSWIVEEYQSQINIIDPRQFPIIFSAHLTIRFPIFQFGQVPLSILPGDIICQLSCPRLMKGVPKPNRDEFNKNLVVLRTKGVVAIERPTPLKHSIFFKETLGSSQPCYELIERCAWTDVGMQLCKDAE
jgi:hypothetical protein